MADPGGPDAAGRTLSDLTEAYGRLTERYEAAGGYEYETRIAQALTGLGFRTSDFGRPVAEFSGGERVRGALARLLLARPGLLLLDEPTNHLDLTAREWLEGFLAEYPGAVVVVSHDRYFLDKLVTRILEVEAGEVRAYAGNYTAFVRRKEEDLLRDAVQGKQMREQMAKLKDFVAKFSAGTRATQAKSKAKMLLRLEGRAAALRRRQTGKPAFRFEVGRVSGREVLQANGLAAGAGDRRLFAGLSFAVRAGDRLGIVGPNGCGKTTLLRSLLGELALDEGVVTWGHGTDPAYLRQDLADLDDAATVLKALLADAALTPGEARSLLGGFQFTGDEVDKRVGGLSGGERSRLALAKLLVTGANVLVLDEPTNHLDVTARTALEDALGGYGGTVLFVSHDRYFIDRVATALLAFEPSGVAYHRGNFSSYQAAKAAKTMPKRPAAGAAARGGDHATQIQALMAERSELEAEMMRDGRAGRTRRARARLARYRELDRQIKRLEGLRDRGRGR